MRKNYNQEETQQKCHQVSEPVVAYGTETNVNTLKQQPSSRERIMASTMSVDEYFDELSPRLDDAETMSIEDARAMTLAAVREEYVNLFGF